MSSFVASPFGYDAYTNAKSPLQQYRQRNFIQQNTGFYEKACRDMNEGPAASNAFISRSVGLIPSAPCNPIIPMQQPTCINPHNAYVGDGSWQETYDMVATPSVRKSCPTSQLSLWRQNKMNQTGQQPPVMPTNSGAQLPQTNVFSPGHPGLSLYRGVGRGYLHTLWPDTLCDPLEKLFKAQSGGPFVPGQAVPYTTFTPAYGQIDYNRETGMQCENASMMQ